MHKSKVDKLDLIKIINFFSSKDPVKRIKMQAIEWEKLQITYLTKDKDLEYNSQDW